MQRNVNTETNQLSSYSNRNVVIALVLQSKCVAFSRMVEQHAATILLLRQIRLHETENKKNAPFSKTISSGSPDSTARN